jgi:hypothetical protein
VDQPWRFYDASHVFQSPFNPWFPMFPPTSIQIGGLSTGYNFIGVKLGDIDNSYDLGTLPLPAPLIDLYAMDEILNNGESYTISLLSDKTLALQGLQLEIDASSSKLQFNNFTSEVLPGFQMSEHVSFEGDKIVIRYVVPLEVMQTGALRIDPGEPILDFNITATANGILSDELFLSNAVDQYMKVSSVSDRIRVRLTWDNEIASRIRDLALHGVSIFPVPAQDMISISTGSDVQQLTYDILDLSGRTVQNGTLNSGTKTIMLSSLQEGMYVLRLIHEDGRRTAQKLLIQR